MGALAVRPKRGGPWQFHPFKDQPLRELLIKGLLRMPELAGETYAKVETSVKR